MTFSLLPKRLAALALAASCVLQSAYAQPDQVHKLIVPFPPGGAADYMARVLVEKLQGELGRSIIVENRPGGGILIGANTLKALPADGSVALLAPDTPMWIAPAIYNKLPFDPAVDFKPVTDVVMVQLGLAVPSNSPINSISDLVSAAKAAPERGTVGITVIGSMVHFLASEFIARSGSNMTLVPYNGATPMMTNLFGGHVAAGLDATTSFFEYSRSGKIRILAVAGAKRSKTLPNVPTFSELGYPTLVADSRYVLYMRAGVPQIEVARWNAAVRKVLAQPDVQEKLERSGYEVLPGSTPEQVAQASKVAADRWLPIIKASGFKGD